MKVSALPSPERIADGIETEQVQRESDFYNNIFLEKGESLVLILLPKYFLSSGVQRKSFCLQRDHQPCRPGDHLFITTVMRLLITKIIRNVKMSSLFLSRLLLPGFSSARSTAGILSSPIILTLTIVLVVIGSHRCHPRHLLHICTYFIANISQYYQMSLRRLFPRQSQLL